MLHVERRIPDLAGKGQQVAIDVGKLDILLGAVLCHHFSHFLVEWQHPWSRWDNLVVRDHVDQMDHIEVVEDQEAEDRGRRVEGKLVCSP